MNAKSFLLLIVIAICAISCSPDNSYYIYGTIDLDKRTPAEGKIYLKKRIVREWYIIDSTEVKGNNFEFSGIADSISILYCDFNGAKLTPIVIEPGQIRVAISSSNFQVNGTPQNNDLYEFYDIVAKLKSKVDLALIKEMDKGLSQTEAMEKLQPLMDELKKTQVDFLFNNINREISSFVFMGIYHQLTLEEKTDYLSQLTPKSLAFDRIPMIIETIELERSTSEGQIFTELANPNTKGALIKLSDLIGKTDYVLLDFWASWCPPCVRSFPELTALYNKYKSTNKLEILGISLDSDHKSWATAIDKYNLNWVHMSDLKGWGSEAAKKYAVVSIPTTILIDKDGKIIARNISHNELEKLLK